MASNVFTYGSLSIPVVMETVTGRQFQHLESQLPKFQRFMIEGRPYPGIIHSENASTIGRVYLNVDEDSLRRLDYFEDDYYARQTVDVELSDGSHIEAFAYVVPASHSKLLSEHLWDEAKFVEVELETYLEQASRWMDNFGNAD